ncbi:MAG: hypothetical protein F6J93_11390 [Oscillatoria sp. SIO1A7]|nr:hypothetical protein [Oscillatoria sp. SIO1A7]
MKIGIIGSGDVGRALGKGWANSAIARFPTLPTLPALCLGRCRSQLSSATTSRNR